MKPRWFFIDKIPFDKMWDDDKFWLSLVLEGRKLKANFIFKEGEIVSSYNIEILPSLG